MTDGTITVFLVDDHAVVREGLRSVLGREPDLRVVGEAASGEEALEALDAVDPMVVVVDQRLPGMQGIELCREIAERRMRGQVVLLSAFEEEHVVDAAMRAGARAYVVKDVEAEALKDAIRGSAHGRTMIDPKVRTRFMVTSDNTKRSGLSPRQLKVLRLAMGGLTAKQIGEAAGLSPHTVKSYLRDAYSILGVNSRSEAVALAIRQGLL